MGVLDKNAGGVDFSISGGNCWQLPGSYCAPLINEWVYGLSSLDEFLQQAMRRET